MTSNADRPRASVDRPDDGRTIEAGDDDTDVAVPLDAPIETPLADLVDQRRPVPIDDDDNR